MFAPIVDSQLELLPWQKHLPNDGSQIGGTMPTAADVVPVPGPTPGVMVFVKGPAYATVEGYITRPNFVTRGFPYTTFNYTIVVDDRTAGQAQVIETDLIRIVKHTDGSVFKYDGSFQINIMEGWMLQVDGPAPTAGAPSWKDTGIIIPALAPNVPHTVSIKHFSDTVKRVHSVLSATIDGVVYPIPAAMQNIPATPSTWAPDTDLPQVQLTTNKGGGGYAVILSPVSLAHSVTA